MATRRKKSVENGQTTTRAFAVVVEELRGQFKVFGEQLGMLNDKFDGKFSALDGRFTALDERFSALDDRFTALDEKVTVGFAQIKGDIADIKVDVGRLQTASLEHGRELKKKADRDELEPLVERIVARTARR